MALLQVLIQGLERVLETGAALMSNWEKRGTDLGNQV